MGANHYLNLIEAKAHSLRELGKVGTFSPLDPFDLAEKMGVKVISVLDIQLPDAVIDQLLTHDSNGWSAGTMRFPTGTNWVVMNPNHQSTRQRATLMEELAHVHLNHRPTDLMNAGNTGFFRSFNKSHEKEAYWVGAAALLPRRVLRGAKTLGLTAGDIASRHQVSHELVRFRENITGVKLLQNSDQEPPREAISTT